MGCHFLLQILPTQGLNPGLQRCRQVLSRLSQRISSPSIGCGDLGWFYQNEWVWIRWFLNFLCELIIIFQFSEHLTWHHRPLDAVVSFCLIDANERRDDVLKTRFILVSKVIFLPVLLRYNCSIEPCKFKVDSTMIWLIFALKFS